MNTVYIYDGSFSSLLNLIFELIRNNIRPDNIKNELYSPSLLDDVINLDFDSSKDVWNKVLQILGEYAANIMYYVFLSEENNKELLLYYYFLNGLKYRKNIVFRRDKRCVSEALRVSSYVVHESHKMKGFLRFKELENKVLYAEMEPTNDVILLVSEHFRKRLKNEYWIIKDVGRGILSVYDKKKYVVVLEDYFVLQTENVSESEQDIENLWKVFYKTIGIKERKNDRCRRNFMPKKYWKYIIEVQEEL